MWSKKKRKKEKNQIQDVPLEIFSLFLSIRKNVRNKTYAIQRGKFYR